MRISKPRPLVSATWRNVRSTNRCSSSRRTSPTSTATVPDSIFERSRMSLMSISRSLPDEWIVRANSTCFEVRLPSALPESWSDRISSELSGVRSSCDMFARNSDLYLEVRASWRGLLFQRLAGLLHFLVLALHLLVLVGQQPGLLLQLLVGVSAVPPGGSAAPARATATA